jgi:hypothetical protein
MDSDKLLVFRCLGSYGKVKTRIHTKLQVKPKVLVMVRASNDFVSLRVHQVKKRAYWEQHRKEFREVKMLHMRGIWEESNVQFSLLAVGWDGNLHKTDVYHWEDEPSYNITEKPPKAPTPKHRKKILNQTLKTEAYCFRLVKIPEKLKTTRRKKRRKSKANENKTLLRQEPGTTLVSPHLRSTRQQQGRRRRKKSGEQEHIIPKCEGSKGEEERKNVWRGRPRGRRTKNVATYMFLKRSKERAKF